MNERPPTRPIEDFPAHSAWVRRLAAHLLEDVAEADDVAQEAWIVLQRQPLGAIEDLRAWLAQVVRNLARRTRARELARRAALRADAALSLAPSSAHVLEAESVRRAVVDAVLTLDEPYRSTLLLHYYEELAPREIARRLGVPGSTVRARLQRGHARVRAKLGERDPRGDGGARAALLLLVDGISARPTSIGTGALMAGSTAKVVGVVACLAALGLWWITADRDRPPSELRDELAGPTPTAARGEPTSRLAEAAAEVDRVEIAAPIVPPDDLWRLAIARPPGVLEGTVIREDDGLPVAGAIVRATTDTGYVAARAELAEDRLPLDVDVRTDASGRFRIDELPVGGYRLRVRAQPDLLGEQSVTATPSSSPVLVALRKSTRSSRIRTLIAAVADESDRPVEDAEVRLGYHDGDARKHERVARTDAQGRAEFAGLELDDGFLEAHVDDRAACLDVRTSTGRHLSWLSTREDERDAGPVYPLVLRATGSISGVVEGGAGSTVRAWRRGALWDRVAWPKSAAADCASDGTFAIRGLAAGLYLIDVAAPTGSRADLVHPYSRRYAQLPQLADLFPRIVQVDPAAEVAVRIRLVPSARVEGHVVDAESGAPVAGAIVHAWVEPVQGGPFGTRYAGERRSNVRDRSTLDMWPAIDVVETRTDADGRYRLDGLAATESWGLEVVHAGSIDEIVERLALVDGETLALEHRLARGGGIQFVGWRECQISVIPEDRSRRGVTVNGMSDPGATCSIVGLAPGRYRIAARHWVEPWSTDLASVDVRAGEMAWIDLRERAPHVAEGRLLLRGVPVAGATIDILEPVDQFLRATTDAAGRFTFRFPFPAHEPALLAVVVPSVAGAVGLRITVPDLLTGASSANRDVELSGTRLRVLVVDANGEPMRAAVEIAASGAATTKRTTDDDGALTLDLVPAGKARFSVETPAGWKFPPTFVDVADHADQEIVLRGPATGSVRVLVLDATGRPSVGARVAIDGRLENSESALASWRSVDARGQVLFAEIPIGPVRVVAMTQEDDFMSQRSTGEDLVVGAGEVADVTLTIP